MVARGMPALALLAAFAVAVGAVAHSGGAASVNVGGIVRSLAAIDGEPARAGEPPRLCGGPSGPGTHATRPRTPAPDAACTALDSAQMRTLYIDLKDLNEEIRSLGGETLNLDDSRPAEPQPDIVPGPSPDEVVAAIRARAAAGTWDSPASLEERNGILIAHNSAEALADASAVADELRGTPGELARRRTAAWQLADMEAEGTSTERAWAREEVERAPDALRTAAANALARGRDVKPSTAPRADLNAPQRVRLDLRVLGLTAAALRDLGIELREPPLRGRRAGMRSSGTFLDDTQLEVLDRALERGVVGRVLDSGTVWCWNGESREVSAGDDGVLRLDPAIAPSGKFVGVRLSLTFRVDGELLFIPSCEADVPDGGTLLVVAADRLPGRPETPVRFLLLTAEIGP